MSFITLNSREVGAGNSIVNKDAWNFENMFREGIHIKPNSSIALTHANASQNSNVLDFQSNDYGVRLFYGDVEGQYNRYLYKPTGGTAYNNSYENAPLKSSLYFPLKKGIGPYPDVVDRLVQTINCCATPSLYKKFTSQLNETTGAITGFKLTNTFPGPIGQSTLPENSFYNQSKLQPEGTEAGQTPSFTYNHTTFEFTKTGGGSSRGNWAVGYTSNEGIENCGDDFYQNSSNIQGGVEGMIEMESGWDNTGQQRRHYYMFGVSRWGGKDDELWTDTIIQAGGSSNDAYNIGWGVRGNATGSVVNGDNLTKETAIWNENLCCDYAFVPVYNQYNITGNTDAWINIVKYCNNNREGRNVMKVLYTGDPNEGLGGEYCPKLKQSTTVPGLVIEDDGTNTMLFSFPNRTLANHPITAPNANNANYAGIFITFPPGTYTNIADLATMINTALNVTVNPSGYTASPNGRACYVEIDPDNGDMLRWRNLLVLNISQPTAKFFIWERGPAINTGGMYPISPLFAKFGFPGVGVSTTMGQGGLNSTRYNMGPFQGDLVFVNPIYIPGNPAHDPQGALGMPTPIPNFAGGGQVGFGTWKLFPSPGVSAERLGFRMEMRGSTIGFKLIVDDPANPGTLIHIVPKTNVGNKDPEDYRLNDGFFPLQLKLGLLTTGSKFKAIQGNFINGGVNQVLRKSDVLDYINENVMLPNGVGNSEQQLFTNMEFNSEIFTANGVGVGAGGPLIDNMSSTNDNLSRHIKLITGDNSMLRWNYDTDNTNDDLYKNANLKTLLGLSSNVYKLITITGFSTQYVDVDGVPVTMDFLNSGILVVLTNLGQINSQIGSISARERVVAVIPRFETNTDGDDDYSYDFVPPSPIYVKLNNPNDFWINNLGVKLLNAFGQELTNMVHSNFSFHLINE